MQEFSLERISGKIHYGRTKEYFKEVISSYNHANYRSATVVLWSVAVCDIIYKLQNLVDLYDDRAAKEILDTVTQIQSQDRKSSAWEVQLVEDVHKKTNLLDSSEYENLRFLQIQRHLSAHPVLNSERELHSPNKETVRSLIRNTLEGLLIKPPFYTQRIMGELLQDLSEAAHALNSKKKVRQYMESRYLSRTTPQVELNIFRSLWKLVFKLEDEECKKNRPVNLSAMNVIADRNEAALVDLLSGDKDYFGNIAAKGGALSALVMFLSTKDKLFDVLSEDAQLKIKHWIDIDPTGKIYGWFVKESLNDHSSDLLHWISEGDCQKLSTVHFEGLLRISDSQEWQESFCKIAATYYGYSSSFDQADDRFQIGITKYISMFDRDSLMLLANEISTNSQCYRRTRAREDYKIIRERIEELYKDDEFDYNAVLNFKRKVFRRSELKEDSEEEDAIDKENSES